MTKNILTVLLVVLLNVLIGCTDIDSGQGQLMPARLSTSLGSAPTVDVTNAGEIDIVEQMAVNRQAYRQGLELLIDHYRKVGNNMKLQWAEKELKALDAIPQYKYIIEASVAGPSLKATTSIPQADDLYKDAVQLQNKAEQLVVVKDDELLRLALDKYNQLIANYPSSNKIDDAAYNAAKIYEHFKDYTIALLYYQRTYQWDPETVYPAMFKAAYILDRHLSRKLEALELYRKFLQTDLGTLAQRDWAASRITELTVSDKKIEEPRKP